jgi:hypothetical protein
MRNIVRKFCVVQKLVDNYDWTKYIFFVYRIAEKLGKYAYATFSYFLAIAKNGIALYLVVVHNVLHPNVLSVITIVVFSFVNLVCLPICDVQEV